MHHWVIWAYPEGTSVGYEFGIDFPTLQEAREVKRDYQAHWPNTRYVIRRRNGPALATAR